MDEIGTVWFDRNYEEWPDSGIRTRIAKVDPRIRVAPEFLDGTARYPFLDPYIHLDGDVLTIRDDYGQRYIYRIRWDDYANGGYLAEWPD
jgi:hypothetical protein